MSFMSQLPWVLVWIVILIFQDANIRKGNMLFSLISIWIALVLSFVWNPVVNLVLGDAAASMQFGGRFWLLFVITAILHVLAMRKHRKPAGRGPQAEETQPVQEIQQSEE